MDRNVDQNILFVLTSHGEMGDTGEETGYFLPEAAHPWSELRDAGCSVDYTTPGGGSPPIDPSSRDLDDATNAAFLESEKGRLEDMPSPEQVDGDDYGAIFFAGGHGTMWDFPRDRSLARLARAIWEKGGVVSAVCHGPAALTNAELSDGSYLVDGRRMTCFTNEEEREAGAEDVVPFLLESRLEERGATIEKADPYREKVVVDGRLVTGQNPASARGVGEAVARVLAGETAPA